LRGREGEEAAGGEDAVGAGLGGHGCCAKWVATRSEAGFR
jgi:hypothetical protein